jgi:hypothetical protein
MLLIPVSNRFLHFAKDIGSNENRALAKMPEFKLTYLDPFPTKYEAYYQDHFFIRNRISKMWSEINRKVFKRSPTDKALIGNDGWLYIKKDELKTYLGQNLFDSTELAKFKNEVIRRRDYLDSLGCKYYFVIAPTKYSVYPEHLPKIYRLRKYYTRTDQIVDIVSTVEGVELIDLRKVLNESKTHGLLYRPSDNHWNALGGYYAYTEIMNRIRNDFPEITPVYPLDSFNIDVQEVEGGNVSQMMNAKDDFFEFIPKITFKKQKVWVSEKAGYVSPKNFGFETDYEMVFTNKNQNDPKILVIRDSFGYGVLPYLSAHFSKSVYIFDEWKYMLNKPIVENEKPDIFMHLTLECFYHQMLENAGK